MAAGGGAAIEIAAAPGFPAGASWGIDDRIVFAGFQTPLRVVDARGGTPDDLTTLGPGLGHLHPEVLPDGRTVLFNEGGWIHALDLATRRRTDRVVEGIGARYAANGHLVLSRGTTLLAAPFDSTRLKLTGPVVPVVEGVEIDRAAGGASHVPSLAAGPWRTCRPPGHTLWCSWSRTARSGFCPNTRC